MKKILLYTVSIIAGALLCYTCNNNKGITKHNLIEINKSLKTYFLNRNITSDYFTDVIKSEPLSYSEINANEKENDNEVYIAKVYLVAKIAMYEGNRKYNVNDTILCYLDKNFKVLRVENKE